jgi:O-antigen/teichoic acid export membrane protein
VSQVQPSNKDQQTSALRNEIALIGKNSLIYVVGRALTSAVGFFMIPVYTRFIVPSNYGANELIEIITAAIIIIISLGVADTMTVYFYDEQDVEKRKKVVSTILIGFGIIAIPIVLFFIAMSSFLTHIVMDEPKYRYFLQIAIITTWFTMLCEIAFSYLRMLYMSRLFIFITTMQLILSLSLNILMVVFMKMDILGIFYSTLITNFLTGSILSVIILRRVGFGVSLPLLIRIIKFGLPLVPSRIGLMLGFFADRFFIRMLATKDPMSALTMLGIYSLGFKFSVIVNRFITVPFNSFWAPRRMELLLSEEPEARSTVARICTYSALLLMYATIGLTAGIKSLIEIVADPRYYGAYVVVPFFSLAYIANGLETHFITGMMLKKKSSWAMYASILSLAVALFWNYIFVPKYGLIGAATSNLAGSAVRLTIIYLVSQKLYRIPFELFRILQLFLIGLVFYAIAQFITFSSPWVTFISRTGFVALYPFGLLVLGFFTKNEVDYVLQLINKRFIRQRA